MALAAAGAVVAVDQATKWVVQSYAGSLPYDVSPGLRLEIHENTGISFSRFASSGGSVTIMVAAVAVAVLVAMVLAPSRYRLSLALVLGGALGNLVDRFRFGAVIDYISVMSWPTFNVADIAIVTGTILVAWGVLRDAWS